jgi:hypothetical protein
MGDGGVGEGVGAPGESDGRAVGAGAADPVGLGASQPIRPPPATSSRRSAWSMRRRISMTKRYPMP